MKENKKNKKTNEKMSQRKHHEEIGKIVNEVDTSDPDQYGEFISSYFAWLSLDEQKEKAEELTDMTK